LMSSTSIGQLMSDMRQLVINLQTRERATDIALAKSQVVQEKISGMKEYQEEVANMNDCWRMQGRKVLVAGLQHENRQILQLKQENSELRHILEDCERTLQLVMQKHRYIVTRLTQQLSAIIRSSNKLKNKEYESSVSEKVVELSRLLNDCFRTGESGSNYDQELIAKLATENACLRELLNISAHNEPGLTLEFLRHTTTDRPNSNSDGIIDSNESDAEGEKEQALCKPTPFSIPNIGNCQTSAKFGDAFFVCVSI
uniref:FGFR1 oncogene partner 2 n=1 Tax=Gongylonema pulchrum TaxID=637853 RepID=A0A183DNC7_9BILA